MSPAELQMLERQVDPDRFDPEIVFLQNKAMKDLEAAKRLGVKTDIRYCEAVADELGARGVDLR
jgi:DNA replication protein DnaD